MNQQKTVSLLLRIGLGFAFLYAATGAFLQPDSWIGWFPGFIRDLIPSGILLPVFSVYEILLAIWLLSGFKTFYAATLAALTVSGIVIFNLGAMDIVFRDVTITFTAIALAALSYKAELQS